METDQDPEKFCVNCIVSARKKLREEQCGPPKTRQLLGEMRTGYQCQRHTSHGLGMPTLGRLDISSVRQVPLYADYNGLERRETDGGRDIVREALCEQDRRVGSEFWVCRERRGEGGSVIVPSGMRDDVSCPSKTKRHE